MQEKTKECKYTQLKPYDAYDKYIALIPSVINVMQTRKYKDGSAGYLIFGNFLGATSKERPSLGSVRANSKEEAVQKAQEIINENIKKFLK